MRGNIILINGTAPLEGLAILLKHLIVTLSRHQTDGLEYGKRGASRLPLYTFLHLKTHNKESGLHLEKYCQLLISFTDKPLIECKISFFTTAVLFMKNKVKKPKIL